MTRTPQILANLLALAMLISSGFVGAQSQIERPESLWVPVPEEQLEQKGRSLLEILSTNLFGAQGPKQYTDLPGRQFSLKKQILDDILAQPDDTGVGTRNISAPVGRGFQPEDSAKAGVQRQIPIPLPNGEVREFVIAPSETMSSAIRDEFPAMRSFRGISTDPKDNSTLRLDISPSGLHAEIYSREGNVIVAPIRLEANYLNQDDGRYHSFEKKEASLLSKKMVCESDGSSLVAAKKAKPAPDKFNPVVWGDTIRTYRLAVAATPEYVEKSGGTKELAWQAIVRTINKVNEIYMRDLAVQFELIENPMRIIFDDDSKNLANNDANLLLLQSQKIIDEIIGKSNYDIGHTFSTGAGGLATLGSAGVDGIKGQGVTGSLNPISDPFDVDYVAHEIGHQFGANHTFNGSKGNCGGSNWNGSTAFEPGSGTTIMAYAGICGDDNLQKNSDDYFHNSSIKEIIAHVSGKGDVTNKQASSNSLPRVIVGKPKVIPIGTPFRLSASGRDDDIDDTLTYVWEQLDTGVQAALSFKDEGSIPLMKSGRPSVNNVREFRVHSDLEGLPLVRLPALSRDSVFSVTVRDNHIASGGVAIAHQQVRFVQEAGPFVLTQPTENIDKDKSLTIKWNVAGTADAPVSESQVVISASTDGGINFRQNLAALTPNDGEEEVTLIGTPKQIMIRVMGKNNSFYALSPNLKVE